MRFGFLFPLVLCTAACGPLPDAPEVTDDRAGGSVSAEETSAAARAVDPDQPGPPERCPETNPCVTRRWTGTRCVDTRLPNGTVCFDGNECDGTSRCSLGRCLSDNIPLSCDDGNACTSDRCVPGSGCQSTATTGNACSDGAQCTVADTCEAGRCVGHGNTSGVPTVPSFSDVTVHAPFGRLVEYGGQRYLEGSSVDIRATLPGCAYVTGVELDGRPLDTVPHTDCDDVGGSDCNLAYYEIVWAFPRTNGTLDTIVRVHFGGPGSSGDLSEVVLIASSAVGSVRHSVGLSRVLDVVPANDPQERVTLSISETRLYNSLIQSTYRRYGDAGRTGTGENALTQPNYGSIVLDVEPTGIHFVSRVTLDRTCHPSARIEGRFVLVKTDSGIDIQWTDGPHIPITIDVLCNIVTLGLVDIFADVLYDGDIREIVDEQIEAQVTAALGASCDIICRAQIQGFEYTHDELRVNLRPTFDAVVVEVPYYRGVPNSTIVRGFPVSSGWPYVFIGSGTARLSECRPGSTSPACGETFAVGPEGTFVWERPFDAVSGSRVPDPWYNPGGPAAYYAQRAAARDQLRGAYRNLSLLPSERIRAGSLYFRSSNSLTSRSLGSPCGYDPSATTELLAFGVNEPGDASYGTGTRRVAVVFAPNASVSDCY